MSTPSEARRRSTASQNGKNPLRGPSGPQPTPSRRASQSTRPPNSISTTAVARSARRILFLEQAALRHQIAMQRIRFLHPLDVLGPGGEGRLQRALLEVVLELRGVVHLLEEADVPVHGLL